MASVDKKLFERLEKKLGVKQRRVYDLINEKMRQTHLPRRLAAIALASEQGINISRFVTDEDLAIIRHGSSSSAPPPVIVPEVATSRRTSKATQGSRRKRQASSTRRGNTVWVVHGRNDDARKAMFAFLRALGLRPFEWTQAVKKTGEASPYVGTILERAFSEAVAIIVLLTPDDEARLKKQYRKSRDSVYEAKLSGQARPNVLFEAGMAFGSNPNSTVLVQLGNVRPFSDVAGRHIVHLSNEPGSRQELAMKLANAGCNVDTSGTDWLEAGDFSL